MLNSPVNRNHNQAYVSLKQTTSITPKRDGHSSHNAIKVFTGNRKEKESRVSHTSTKETGPGVSFSSYLTSILKTKQYKIDCEEIDWFKNKELKKKLANIKGGLLISSINSKADNKKNTQLTDDFNTSIDNNNGDRRKTVTGESLKSLTTVDRYFHTKKSTYEFMSSSKTMNQPGSPRKLVAEYLYEQKPSTSTKSPSKQLGSKITFPIDDSNKRSMENTAKLAVNDNLESNCDEFHKKGSPKKLKTKIRIKPPPNY